nr:putative polyketide synthase [Lachnum palmae]
MAEYSRRKDSALAFRIRFSQPNIVPGNWIHIDGRGGSKAIVKRRIKIIAGDDQQWYKVEIKSFDGGNWVERCVGKVTSQGVPSLDDSSAPSPKGSLARQVGRAYWYDVTADTGLQYGPAFQGLDKISTSVTDLSAVASISEFEDTTEYSMHPVTMDQAFQILMAAKYQGQGRKLRKLSIPSFIEKLAVSGASGKSRVGGKLTEVRPHGLTGDVTMVSEEGQPSLSIKGCRISDVSSDKQKVESKLFSSTDWKTDASLCNLNESLLAQKSELDKDTVAAAIKIIAHKNPKLKVLELGNCGTEEQKLEAWDLRSHYNLRLGLAQKRSQSSIQSFENFDPPSRASAHAGFYFGFGKSSEQPVNKLTFCPEFDSGPKNSHKREAISSDLYAMLLDCGFEFKSKDKFQSAFVARLKTAPSNTKKITLLSPKDDHPLVGAVRASFQERGIECSTCNFEDNFPDGQDIISLVDFGEPFIYNFTEARFQSFVKKISAFKGSMIWVTPQVDKDPNTSMIIGLTRTLRVELRKDITTVEVDTEDPDVGKALLKIYQGLGSRLKSKDVDPDYEYAIVEGEIKIPRLYWTTGGQELAQYTKRSTTNGYSSVSSPIGTSAIPVSFRSDACYFLVGGLGGLGREISRWMVENGARNLLYLSRSAKEGPDTKPFFDELRSQGCSILTFAGSVNNLKDVEAAVKQATKPIAGVMQMSAVMRDNFLSQMTFSEWETCVQPKVKGTWNLHHALSSSKLDFFLLFSSICGITGQWGQSNYNSANSFLDAFVKYRHGQNLAASAIDIGFMGGVGMAMENAGLVKNLKKSGYYFLSEPDLIDALAISIANSRPGDKKSHFALGITTTKPITAPATRPAWKKDTRMAVSHHFVPPQAPTFDEVKDLLDDALRNEECSD